VSLNKVSVIEKNSRNLLNEKDYMRFSTGNIIFNIHIYTNYYTHIYQILIKKCYICEYMYSRNLHKIYIIDTIETKLEKK